MYRYDFSKFYYRWKLLNLNLCHCPSRVVNSSRKLPGCVWIGLLLTRIIACLRLASTQSQLFEHDFQPSPPSQKGIRYNHGYSSRLFYLGLSVSVDFIDDYSTKQVASTFAFESLQLNVNIKIGLSEETRGLLLDFGSFLALPI